MTMDMSQFTTVAPQRLRTFEGTPGRAYELAWQVAAQGPAVRVLRGHKMRTTAGLFDEMGAALQFPDYFGGNWAALDECITDLSWMPASAYLLVIVRAAEVLTDESEEMPSLFADVLDRAAASWAEPVAEGEEWDRGPVAFHVVLQILPEDTNLALRRWRRDDLPVVNLTAEE